MNEKTKLNLLQLLGLDNKNNAIDCLKTIEGRYLIVYAADSSLPGVTVTGVGFWPTHVNLSAVKRRWNRFTQTEKNRIHVLAQKKGIDLQREFKLR